MSDQFVYTFSGDLKSIQVFWCVPMQTTFSEHRNINDKYWSECAARKNNFSRIYIYIYIYLLCIDSLRRLTFLSLIEESTICYRWVPISRDTHIHCAIQTESTTVGYFSDSALSSIYTIKSQFEIYLGFRCQRALLWLSTQRTRFGIFQYNSNCPYNMCIVEICISTAFLYHCFYLPGCNFSTLLLLLLYCSHSLTLAHMSSQIIYYLTQSILTKLLLYSWAREFMVLWAIK